MTSVRAMQTRWLATTLMALLTAAPLVASPSRAAEPTPDVAAIDIAKLPGVVLTPKLAEALPAGLKSSGVLKVATDLTPPISFHADDGELVGIDTDLAEARGPIILCERH